MSSVPLRSLFSCLEIYISWSAIYKLLLENALPSEKMTSWCVRRMIYYKLFWVCDLPRQEWSRKSTPHAKEEWPPVLHNNAKTQPGRLTCGREKKYKNHGARTRHLTRAEKATDVRKHPCAPKSPCIKSAWRPVTVRSKRVPNLQAGRFTICLARSPKQSTRWFPCASRVSHWPKNLPQQLAQPLFLPFCPYVRDMITVMQNWLN